MNGHLAIERAIRGHERRWGKSLLPIKGTVCSSLVPRLKDDVRYPRQWVRTVDHESGSIVDWDFSSHRIRRIAERDPL